MAVINQTFSFNGTLNTPNALKSIDVIAVGGGGGGGKPAPNNPAFDNGTDGTDTTVGNLVRGRGGRVGGISSGGAGGGGTPLLANGSTGVKGFGPEPGPGCPFSGFGPRASAGYTAPGNSNPGSGGSGATFCSSGSVPATFGGGGGGAGQRISTIDSNGNFPFGGFTRNTSYPITIGQGGDQGGPGPNRGGADGIVFARIETFDAPTGLIRVTSTNDSTPGTTTTIIRGQETARISWQTTNATNVNIGNVGGNVGVSGSVDVNPSSTTTYNLTASNPGFPNLTNLGEVTVVVVTPPTFSVTANPTTIPANTQATISWNSTNANTLTWTAPTGALIQNTQLNSSTPVTLSQTTTYTGFTTGQNGLRSAPASATVNVVPLPTATLTAPNPINYNTQLLVSFNTTNATGGVTLSGTLNYIGSTQNITPINFNGGTSVNRVDLPIPITWNDNGPLQINLVLTARGGLPGLNATSSRSVNVTIPRPTIQEFFVNPTSIISGGPTGSNLRWRVTGVGITTVVINPLLGNQLPSGSSNVNPATTTTYTIAATGTGGTSNAQTTLQVFQRPNVVLTLDKNPIVRSVESTTLRWTTTGDAATAFLEPIVGATNINSQATVSPSTDTTYRITVNGPGGTDSDEITLQVLQLPTANLTGPVNILYGQQGSIQYAVTNAVTSVTLTPIYNYRGQSITGPVVDLVEGINVNETYNTTIPYSTTGPFTVTYILNVIGFGGLTAQDAITIPIIVDETPDNVIIPSSEEKIKDEQPIFTPDERLTSVRIQVNDIDIPVEIRSDRPIEVRFDDETVWNKIRPII